MQASGIWRARGDGSRRRKLVATAASLSLALTISPALAGVVDTAQCKRDLFFAKSSLSDMRARLDRIENAPLGTQCAVWRAHVENASQAGAVFGRCLTGTERAEFMAQMAESAAGFSDMLKRKCPRLEGPAGQVSKSPERMN